MFNITETQILYETLIHIGILEDDIPAIIDQLHPYSQQFSTAQNTFPELIAQIESISDMDELLEWIQSILATTFDDAITTDNEYDSDHPPYFFDDYDSDDDDDDE